jgi:hypothetical protein
MKFWYIATGSQLILLGAIGGVLIESHQYFFGCLYIVFSCILTYILYEKAKYECHAATVPIREQLTEERKLSNTFRTALEDLYECYSHKHITSEQVWDEIEKIPSLLNKYPENEP